MSSEPANTIALTINGQPVQAAPGSTILAAARAAGVEIPTICYHPSLTPNAVCRMCAVEVQGARVLQPACVVQVAPNMVVNTESERVNTARRVILELLASAVDLHDAPEIQAQIARYGADAARFGGGRRRDIPLYDDNPFYIRDYSQCIMCWRCIQVCADDVQFTYALTWGGRGLASHVGTAFGEDMPDTSCVFCGNCVGVCPTGALKGKVEFEREKQAG
ncbi:2Fe-2S iron-sulfur cluster-binding protein [Kouleothrix sp.]|uniref:2Fe-2S iron-sulfur cluster-binding protein n=1 Tax=Kouleothrix sp. TaxID=2779161 RepID=UPI00391A010D